MVYLSSKIDKYNIAHRSLSGASNFTITVDWPNVSLWVARGDNSTVVPFVIDFSKFSPFLIVLDLCQSSLIGDMPGRHFGDGFSMVWPSSLLKIEKSGKLNEKL